MTDFASSGLRAADERTKGYIEDFIDQGRVYVLRKAVLDISYLPYFEKLYEGKVRDMYICRDYVVIITTDRQSAFDRQLAEVPYKGQVLNLLSQWWFEQSRPLLSNHLLAVPHPNVTIAKRCQVFPVEFVVRAFITGSTSTSLWTNYNKGTRVYCGHHLPDGLVKNQRLSCGPLLTPTTKSDDHDELISAEEIIATGLMSQEEWDEASRMVLALFEYGQKMALKRDLLLVDTKYELGKDSEGRIMVLDEVHTPDSSRYWVASSYQERFYHGQEPDNIDKEFLRKWYAAHCDPYHDEVLPTAPPELVNELSRRYLLIFEQLTGFHAKDKLIIHKINSSDFDSNDNDNASDIINEAVRAFFQTQPTEGE